VSVFDIVMHTIAWWSIGSTIAGWVHARRRPPRPDIRLVRVTDVGSGLMTVTTQCRLCEAERTVRGPWTGNPTLTCRICGASTTLGKIQRYMRAKLREQAAESATPPDAPDTHGGTETIH
jgi:hypothetical protein